MVYLESITVDTKIHIKTVKDATYNINRHHFSFRRLGDGTGGRRSTGVG